MKKRINNFFKEVFSNRKTKLMFCTVVLSLILLIGITFSWFVSIIELPQNEIKTGTIEVVCKAYDENGEFISLLGNYEEFLSKDENKNLNTYFTPYKNVPLFNIDNWSANSATTVYISLENSGTLDIDYSLSFVVNGMAEDLKNIGGYWYKIQRIKEDDLNYGLLTDLEGESLQDVYHPLEVDYSKVIGKYIENDKNKLVLCSDDCGKVNADGSSTSCEGTQHNTSSRNLVTIGHFSEQSSLPVDGGKCIYRIDLGLRSECIDPRYTSAKFSVSGEIYATQKGAIANPDGLGATFTVTDDSTFLQALDNALPGDTIVLGNKIKFDGDLVINKAINLNTYGNDLIVNGNLVYNFVSKHSLKINLNSGGNIYINKIGQAGGDLEINTPNSEVLIMGNNYTTNIYVEDRAYFNVTNDSATDGLLINGANIVNKEGAPKEIDIDSNSKITVAFGAELEDIEAVSNSSNITIINYGTIEKIFFNKMLFLDSYPDIEGVDTQYPQINIQNYNKILTAINLPRWSTPFYDAEYDDGYKHGNTLIERHWGALEMSVLEELSEYNYLNKHIIDHNIKDVCVVPEVPGKNNSLIVYYGNYEDRDKPTSLLELLTTYFEEETGTSGSIIEDEINKVEKLRIVSIKEKELTDNDWKLLKNMSLLSSIDMSNVIVEGNTVPEGAFENKEILKEIILPSTITTILTRAFKGTGMKKIVVPASVTSYAWDSWPDVTYVFYESLKPILSTSHNAYYNHYYGNHYIFVNEAVVDDYSASFGYSYKDEAAGFAIAKRIYPMGEITDDGQHVVRKIANGYELVCYTGDGEKIKSGFNLTLNGEEVKVISIGKCCYSNVKTPFEIEFDSSVETIGEGAFAGSKVKDIQFNEIRYIKAYAFWNCTYLMSVNTAKVETIDEYAFNGCNRLFDIECPNLLSLGNYVFREATYLAQIKFYKVEFIGEYALNNSNNLVRLYFFNDSFENVNYSWFYYVKHSQFKIFVKHELVEDFRALGCVRDQWTKYNNLVYSYGDSVGDLKYTKVFDVDGEFIEKSILLGDYVVRGDDDNAEIICCNFESIDEDYTVPGEFTYKNSDGIMLTKKITSVGEYAYQKIVIGAIKLTFGDSIETIKDYGFYGVTKTQLDTSIEYINFNNVKEVGDYSFYNLQYLKSLVAPELLTIGENAFANDIALKEMTLPKVETLNYRSFYYCTSLFTVELPSIVNILGLNGYAYTFQSCTNLVSLRLGSNLTKITGEGVVNTANFRELFIEIEDYTDVEWNKYFIINVINPGLKVYVEPGTEGKQVSQLLPYVREKGYKSGICEVTSSDGRTYNLGEYILKDINVYGQEGVSICSYNFDAVGTPENYKIPDTIDGKKVLRTGYRSYQKFNFEANDLSVDGNGENFDVGNNLLVVGIRSFTDSKIRVSNLKNIKHIEDYGFYNCDNIYLIEAPNLEYIGESGFHDCNYLVSFRAERLYEIGKNAFSSLSRAYQIITNIQKMAEANWTSSHTIKLITIAMEDCNEIEGFSNGGNYCRALITNSTIAGKYDRLRYNTYSKDEVKFIEPYQKKIYDTGGNVIYLLDAYKYMINASGDDVIIYKCFLDSFTSDHTIPGQLDNRNVVTVGQHSYSRVDFNGNQLTFANTITTIEQNALQHCNIGGELNTNQITEIGTHALYNNPRIKSLVGPKITTIGAYAIDQCTDLTTIKLPLITKILNNPFRNCPNLEVFYFENISEVSADAFFITSDFMIIINKEITSVNQIKDTNWSAFSNITIYVPFNSIQYYKEFFADSDKYVNFKILPYGTFASVDNNETGIADQFILREIEYGYDYETNTYLKGYEVINIISINNNVIIPDEWTYDGITLPIVSISKKSLEGQITILNLTLPKYLIAYEELAFQGGKNLQNIFIHEDNEYFASDNGILYTKDYKELICYPKAHKGEDYTLREETISIRSYAFKDCLNLCNLVTNNNLKYIGANAFEGTILRTIEFKVENAPIVSGENVFDPNNNGLIIYVPATAINNYKNVMAFRYYKILIKNNNQ